MQHAAAPVSRVASLCAVLIALSVATPGAQTADDLIAHHIEALGGLAKLKAIESLKLVGTMRIVGDFSVEYVFTAVARRPGKVREEFSVQGITGVQAWDGAEGWQIMPFGGRKDPERLSRDDSKDLIDDADIDGPLVEWQSKGSRVEYIGTEDVDGTMAHKLRLTKRDGDVLTFFLDPDYHVIIRIQRQRLIRGVQMETETDLGNYERVNGVLFPFLLESGQRGGPKAQKIVIHHAEVNLPTDAATFAFPGAKTR